MRAAEKEAEGRSGAAPGPVGVWLRDDEPDKEGATRPEPKTWVRHLDPLPPRRPDAPDDMAILVQVWENGKLTWCRVGGRLLRGPEARPAVTAAGGKERRR